MRILKKFLFLTTCFAFCIFYIPVVDAQVASSTAFFRLTTAGPVPAPEADNLDRTLRRVMGDYGVQVMEASTLSSKLNKNNPRIVELCEENDLPCFGDLANKLGVKYLVFGVAERIDQRLAIELKLFQLNVLTTATGTKYSGEIVKQELDYFTGAKNDSVEKVCRRVVGKVFSRNGYLEVSTNAPGAEILVDGRKLATFPLNQPLVVPQGHHTVTLRKSGYEDYNGSIDINVEEKSVFKGALKPMPFKLSIDSQPTNANVFLGEVNIGYTPLNNFEVTDFAKKPLRLQYNQYFEFKMDLDVVPGGTYKNSVALKPQFGDLLIVSEALDAKVMLDGKFVGNTPMQLLERIPMGEHTIELANSNYFPFKQKINLIPGEKNQFTFNPEARYAWLSVTANVERATIYLNDQLVGYSPYDNFVKLKPGHYKIKLTKQNYFDYQDDIELKTGKRINYSADLKTQLAAFSLSSNVIGAKVFLNDRYLGETPLKPIDNLPLGEYKLSLTKANYFDYVKTINIKPGRVNSHFSEMITTLGKLTVDCPVKGVQIFLGDRLLGLTPGGIFEGIQPGSYTIRLNKEGYEPHNGQVVIKSNEIVHYTADLKTTTSTLQVTANLTGANVYINGRMMGSTPTNIPLKVGDYTLEVRSKGYRDYRTKITVYADRPSSAQVTLTPKPFELVIDADQRGANVELDGASIGTTPLNGYRGSIFGQHTLRISKAGFKTVEKPIMLNPGARIKVSLKLKPNS